MILLSCCALRNRLEKQKCYAEKSSYILGHCDPGCHGAVVARRATHKTDRMDFAVHWRAGSGNDRGRVHLRAVEKPRTQTHQSAPEQIILSRLRLARA